MLLSHSFSITASLVSLVFRSPSDQCVVFLARSHRRNRFCWRTVWIGIGKYFKRVSIANLALKEARKPESDLNSAETGFNTTIGVDLTANEPTLGENDFQTPTNHENIVEISAVDDIDENEIREKLRRVVLKKRRLCLEEKQLGLEEKQLELEETQFDLERKLKKAKNAPMG